MPCWVAGATTLQQAREGTCHQPTPGNFGTTSPGRRNPVHGVTRQAGMDDRNTPSGAETPPRWQSWSRASTQEARRNPAIRTRRECRPGTTHQQISARDCQERMTASRANATKGISLGTTGFIAEPASDEAKARLGRTSRATAVQSSSPRRHPRRGRRAAGLVASHERPRQQTREDD